MPEYLAPGVFVEEVPSSLRALEGVSTSTAAFVGPTQRGPVAGGALPFTPSGGFTLAADPAPALVTSFGEFVRQFGPPLRLPVDTDGEDRGYLGHAAKAFFDNGGKRLYVARVVDPATATRNQLRLGQGVVLRLGRRANAGDTRIELSSLRGISVGTGLTFRRRTDGSNALATAATSAVLAGTVPAPFALLAGDTVTVTVSGSPPASMTSIAASPVDLASAAAAPTFNIAVNDTLTMRVGASGPVQTATFDLVTANDHDRGWPARDVDPGGSND